MGSTDASALSHAAVAVGAFTLGALCSRRGHSQPEPEPEPRGASEGEGGGQGQGQGQGQPPPPQPPPGGGDMVWHARLGRWHPREAAPRNKNARQLFKGEESTVRVLCAGTLAEFQGTIAAVVREQDRVLEVGVSGGGTSAMLRRASPHVLAVDVERKDWAAAVLEAGGSVVLIDPVTDIGGLAALPIEPTVLYVDMASILGHDPAFDGIALLRQLGRVFRASATTIVVRSRALRAHSTHFIDPHGPNNAAPPADATLQHAPPLKGPPKVYCSVGVAEYRKTISWLVHADDKVLEIGCQGGVTTDLISQHIRRLKGSSGAEKLAGVLGVDVAKKSIAHACKNFPDTRFDVLDGWDTAGVLELGRRECGDGSWSVVYVDISGLSGRAAVLDALALVQGLRRALRPTLRAVVIKSRCLRDFANGFQDARSVKFPAEKQAANSQSDGGEGARLRVPPRQKARAKRVPQGAG